MRSAAASALAVTVLIGPLSLSASAGTQQYWDGAEYQNFTHFSNQMTMNGGITEAYVSYYSAVNTTRGYGESSAPKRVESSYVARYTDQYCQWRTTLGGGGAFSLKCWVKTP